MKAVGTGTVIAALFASSDLFATELLHESNCRQINESAPIVRYVSSDDTYYGAVIYARSVVLAPGDTVLVLSEVQAINDVGENVMLGTYLTGVEGQLPEGAFALPSDDVPELARMLNFNVTPENHYGVASRHLAFQAEEGGTYDFGLVVYGGAWNIDEAHAFGIRENACSLTVIRLN